MIAGKDSPYLSVLLFSRRNRALLTAVTVTTSAIQLLIALGIAPLESAIIILRIGEPPRLLRQCSDYWHGSLDYEYIVLIAGTGAL
jgi:hypothetical protein